MKQHLDTLTADAVELLKGMVAVPSPSFSEDDVCTYISSWMDSKHLNHKRIGNNLIALLSKQDGIDPETFRGKPTLMLCAHIDTVSAGEDYSFDPYIPDYAKAAEVITAKITNGELSEAPKSSVSGTDIVAGLGSNDDGASVVSMIAAFRYHTIPGSVMNTNLALVLTCEEECSGINGMTGLWGKFIRKAGKGTCLADATEDKDKSVAVDFAIIGEPTGMKAATSERGLLVIDATAHGVSGHAARNEGINAIDIAINDIESIRRHRFAKLSPLMGKVNLNVTQINAGTAHNVIPDTCTFVIDVRPTEQYTNEEILHELQKLCKSELKARNLRNRSSATYKDSPLQKTAEALGIETFSSPTTSDWMRIDCDAIKMGPGNSARSHRTDEFVFIREIEKGIETYIRLIETL